MLSKSSFLKARKRREEAATANAPVLCPGENIKEEALCTGVALERPTTAANDLLTKDVSISLCLGLSLSALLLLSCFCFAFVVQIR